MQIISLITDLGLVDHYTGLLKATILRQSEQVSFVDISHSVDSHDIQQAAYFLKAVVKQFPANTIHIISVYTSYSEDPEFVVFEFEGQYFIGPNNGVFSLVFSELDEAHIYKIQMESYHPTSAFEYIAKGVEVITSGAGLPAAGKAVPQFEHKLDIMPVITENEIRATIIYVDQFDNVILNVTRALFEQERKGRSFKLFFQRMDPITQISKGYGDVSVGDVLCFFNSNDHLEIAINMGKASSMLDLYKNENIQITFEA